jgi:NAD(P)-dependent dehydrogenase (short-subunit alcohol dehydrogenase family)
VPLALITGASSGIGRASALRLASSGWTVLAGVRDRPAGERLEHEGAASAAQRGGRVQALLIDVTDAQEIAGAAERVEEEAGRAGSPGGGLDALVNNAGIGVGGPLELAPIDEVRRQLEVNVLGQIAVMQALLPALRRARGRVVFLSSIGGRIAMPFLAPYAASKHAVEAIGDALRGELRTSGVQVTLIEPGSVATPIWAKGKAELDRLQIPSELDEQYGHVPAAMARVLEETTRRGIPPERVAETIERALAARRMKPRYVVGSDVRAALLIRGLLPAAVFDRLLQRQLGI